MRALFILQLQFVFTLCEVLIKNTFIYRIHLNVSLIILYFCFSHCKIRSAMRVTNVRQ